MGNPSSGNRRACRCLGRSVAVRYDGDESLDLRGIHRASACDRPPTTTAPLTTWGSGTPDHSALRKARLPGAPARRSRKRSLTGKRTAERLWPGPAVLPDLPTPLLRVEVAVFHVTPRRYHMGK